MSPRDPLIGSVLDGRFSIERRLGAGGMGTVYVGRQLSTGLDRAIKVVRWEHMHSPRRIRRFAREAEIIKQLRDPHTVQLIDQGQTDDGRLYLVYELLHGETLGARLKRGRLGVDETLDLMAAVCHSLAEAHARGIVHRDLKPENIFIATLGHREVVKVLDFGIARWVGSTSTTGHVVGTAAYMAPEQALAQSVDGRADLYSLGVVAYECLCQQRPFEAPSVAVMLHEQAFTPPPPLMERAPDLSPAMAGLVMTLLRKSPDERLADAVALGAAVARLRHGSNDDSGVAPVVGAGAGRGARAAAALAVALSVALAAGVWWGVAGGGWGDGGSAGMADTAGRGGEPDRAARDAASDAVVGRELGVALDAGADAGADSGAEAGADAGLDAELDVGVAAVLDAAEPDAVRRRPPTRSRRRTGRRRVTRPVEVRPDVNAFFILDAGVGPR